MNKMSMKMLTRFGRQLYGLNFFGCQLNPVSANVLCMTCLIEQAANTYLFLCFKLRAIDKSKDPGGYFKSLQLNELLRHYT